jgi:hypothetical protein
MNAQLARKQDGSLTVRAQRAELTRVANALAAKHEEISGYSARFDAGEVLAPETLQAWQDAYDEITALDTELREIQRNPRAITVGSTAWLAANNID